MTHRKERTSCNIVYQFDRHIEIEYRRVRIMGIADRLHEFLQQYAKIFCNVHIPDIQRSNDSAYAEILSAKQAQKIGKAMLTHEDTWMSSLHNEHLIGLRDLDPQRIWKLRNHFLEGGNIRMHWDSRHNYLQNTEEYWPYPTLDYVFNSAARGIIHALQNRQAQPGWNPPENFYTAGQNEVIFEEEL